MYATLWALMIICLTAIKALKGGFNMWQYDPRKTDWDNTVDVVKSMGYTPVHVSFDSFIANILLHYEGACEEEREEELTLKDYLEIGIRDREEGMLSDFDYE